MDLKTKLLAILAGLLFGYMLQGTVSTQNAELLFGSDSSSGAPVVIQTDGSNALKVVSK
jgi:hypothetical protein